MLGSIGILRLCRRLPTRFPHPQAPSICWHIRQHPRGMATSTFPRPLDFNAGPLVWIDCEMTGLNHKKDKIIEIAILITNGNLELVDEGIEYVINTDKEYLDGMDEWCTEQHGRSGLTKACLESPYELEFVSKKVLDYIKRWIPKERTGVLAGSSVHVDRMFLCEHMPEVVDWLHYRIVDVSSIKEVSRRWYFKRGYPPKGPDSNHRALDDIRASIQELQWYRDNIFRSPDAIPRSIPSPPGKQSLSKSPPS